jgi:CheY-like chemotaxis protein
MASDDRLPSKKKILLVDNDGDLVYIIAGALEEYGYAVESFTDPLEALERFSQNPYLFPVVLLDVRMPVMDGIELSKELFKMRSGLNVILMTALEAADRLVQKAQRLPRHEIILKPFRINDLLDKLRYAEVASSAASSAVGAATRYDNGDMYLNAIY